MGGGYNSIVKAMDYTIVTMRQGSGNVVREQRVKLNNRVTILLVVTANESEATM